MSIDTVHDLPWAPAGSGWAWEERSGAQGSCDLLLRVKTPDAQGPPLPIDLQLALPLILHEWEQCPDKLLELEPDRARRAVMLERLQRVMPRLLTYRWLDASDEREFVFDGFRPAGAHVLARVMESQFKFRLEDLSHFASHGALVVEVLNAFGLEDVLDASRIIYSPAVDAPYPFKFFPVGGHGARNRDVYVKLLSRLLRQTESDEAFRARNFRELARGFQKFGPAAATPQFQQVELRLWRLLSYLAARLRVKAGRLTDTKDPEKARGFIDELHAVHAGLDDLVHLPSRLAAYFRTHYDIEFGRLYEHALAGLEEIAKRVDCDLEDRERSIDAIAELVSEFRRLGSISPLEALEEQDREVAVAYGGAHLPPVQSGWARTYQEAIYTGAARFDVRRFTTLSIDDTSEEDLDLEFDLSGSDEQEAEDELEEVRPEDAYEDAETLVEDEGHDVDAPSAEELTSSDEQSLDESGVSDISDLVEGMEGDEETGPARPAPRKAPAKPAPKPAPSARRGAPPARKPGARPAAGRPAESTLRTSGPRPALGRDAQGPAAGKPPAAPAARKTSGATPVPPGLRTPPSAPGSGPAPGSAPGSGRTKVTPPAMTRPPARPKPAAPPPKAAEPPEEETNFEDLLREAADEFGS